jgi:hypothetical protein
MLAEMNLNKTLKKYIHRLAAGWEPYCLESAFAKARQRAAQVLEDEAVRQAKDSL